MKGRSYEELYQLFRRCLDVCAEWRWEFDTSYEGEIVLVPPWGSGSDRLIPLVFRDEASLRLSLVQLEGLFGDGGMPWPETEQARENPKEVL